MKTQTHWPHGTGLGPRWHAFRGHDVDVRKVADLIFASGLAIHCSCGKTWTR